MTVKYSDNIKDKEVISNKQEVALYTPNNDTLSEICFVKILNPRLEGSAYYFHTLFNVGVDTPIGFTTGKYVYIDNIKYVEIDLLLPPKLAVLYNHPISSMHGKLPDHIKYYFKQKKRLAGCSLLFEVPTYCFIKESEFSFYANGATYSGSGMTNSQDTTSYISDTDNTTYNDGSGSDNSNNLGYSGSSNTPLLLAAALVLFKFLKK